MKNENKSENEQTKEIVEENMMIYHKYKDDDSINDLYDSFTYLDIAIIIVKQSLILIISFLIAVLRFTVLFIFSKSLGNDFLTALAIMLPIFSMLQIQFPWATTQYYGYIASKYYSQNSFRNIGLITNKIIVMNISIAIILTICFYTIIPVLLATFLETEKSIEYMYTLSRYLGISLVFQYWQFILMIYFLSVEYFYHLPIAVTSGFVVQIIGQLILIVALKQDFIGIGVAYALGNITSLSINTYFFFFKNKYDVVIPIKIDETFDNLFSEFIPYSLKVGIIVFLNYISLEIVPTMSLIFNSVPEFTTIGILQNLFLVLNSFHDSIATSNNFLLNRCIGKNKYKLFKSVLLVSTGIITLLTITFIAILWPLLENIISIYTNDATILENVTKLKFSFILMLFTSSYISFLNECLAVFEDYNLPIINIIVFRYFGTILVAYLAHTYWNWGINSLFYSFSINNVFILVINYFRLISVLSAFSDRIKNKIE